MPFQNKIVHHVSFSLFFIHYFHFFITARDYPVNCRETCSTNSCHEHCVSSKDGVYGLNCYGYPSNTKLTSRSYLNHWICVWESGKQASSRYTLFIQQKKSCKMFAGISRMSQIIQPEVLLEKQNMTVHVVEESDGGNCTKAVFTGVPQHLVRCGPPNKVNFNRHSRQMEVNVFWQPENININQYIVTYWTHKDQNRDMSTVIHSRDRNTCIVDNLNASLSYEIQIQCVSSIKGLCRQCLPSAIFRVSPELTVKPSIEGIREILQLEGRRNIVIKWKFAQAELAEGYSVTVEKLSGETPRETFNCPRPEITLVLSHSAYLLIISAFHSAATSPALEWTIPPVGDQDLPAERLNVTFNGNTSFTISWKRDLVKTYNCFCVEWWQKGEKPSYKSFYEKENDFEVIFLKEPLQPYKRYKFSLHTRPDKNTCNLKKINDSETTYGSIHAYTTEGRPVCAPGNISSHNETQTSVVIKWDSISEEDSRGFLLGYQLHYRQSKGAGTDTNVTVGPESNCYELVDLQISTEYRIHMSAFTSAGVGVRSSVLYFATKPQDLMTVGGALSVMVCLIIVLMCACLISPMLIKRSKSVWWPNIPNPSYSFAIQTLQGVYELELLEPIKTQNMEAEGDSSSLQLIEKVTNKANISNFNCGFDSDPHCNRELEHMNGTPPQTGSEGLSEDHFLSSTTLRRHQDLNSVFFTPSSANKLQPQLSTSQTARHQAVFMSDYTTMELFQLAMPLDCPSSSNVQEQELTREEGLTSLRPDLDYVQQSLCSTLFLSQGGALPPRSTDHSNTVQ